MKYRAWIPRENKFVYSDQDCYTKYNELIKWRFNEDGEIEVGYHSFSGHIYFTLETNTDRFAGVYTENGERCL